MAAGPWLLRAVPRLAGVGKAAAKPITSAATRQAVQKGAQSLAREGVEEAAEAGAKTAFRQAGAQTAQAGFKGTMNKLALKGMRTGMYASAAYTGLIAVEYFSDHALSRAAPDMIQSVAEGIKDISPQMATLIKENGLGAIATYSDVAGTNEEAAVITGAGILENNGQKEAAVAFRLGYAMRPTGPVTFNTLQAPEDEKTQVFARTIIEESGLGKEQIEAFFAKRPQLVGATEEHLSINLSQEFPGLKDVTAPAQTTSQTASSIGSEFQQTFEDAQSAAQLGIAAKLIDYILQPFKEFFEFCKDVKEDVANFFENFWDDTQKDKLVAAAPPVPRPAATPAPAPEPEPEPI